MKSRTSPKTATPGISCLACPVRQLSVYQSLPESKLELVRKYRTGQTTLSSKSHLYQEGHKHDYIYTLVTGWVMLYKTLNNGGRQVLRYALPGDFLSLQPDADSPMNHSALTLTECIFCVFPRQNLLTMFRENPELALEVAWVAARDLKLGHEYLANIGRRSAKERVAFLFLELFHRLQARIPSAATADTIPLPMTQEDIADTLGLTVVHVNRTLRNLREEGIAQIAHHQLTIMNYPELSRLAGFDEHTIPN